MRVNAVAASVSVEDMVQTSVLVSSDVGIRPASSGTLGSLCSDESEVRDFDKMTDLVLTANAFPGRHSRKSVQTSCEDLLGDVCTRFDRNLLASSHQRMFSAAWPQYRGWLQTLRQAGISRPHHGATHAAASCESQDKSLDSKSTVPIVLEVTESQ